MVGLVEVPGGGEGVAEQRRAGEAGADVEVAVGDDLGQPVPGPGPLLGASNRSKQMASA